MKIRQIYYHTRCNRRIKKLGSELREIMRERIAIFREDCFDSRLKTHKLHGKQDGLYSFSINHSYRVVFRIIEKGVAGIIDIGDHSIYE